jgi:hypothetical protein
MMNKQSILFLALMSCLFFSCGDAEDKTIQTDSAETLHVDTIVQPGAINVDTPLTQFQKPVSELIRVQSPIAGEIIRSPFKITGEAVGFWYFEADFPVRLYDEKDSLLSTAIAMAQGEWMTENFVPFETELVFQIPAGQKTGKLVFERSNPSDMREHDRSLTIPVKFN